MSSTRNKIEEIDPELWKIMNKIIHDWRNMKRGLDSHSRLGKYKELTWSQVEEYWIRSSPFLDKAVEKMCELLYDRNK